MSGVQRVVRDIRRVLQLGVLPADLNGAAAAQEYAELCRDANERLGQCMRHIESGNLRAAMHVSEATPALLDFCAALDFEGAERWRAFAAQNGWPVPPAIDERAIQSINDAYSSALALEPLIKQLQLAVFDKNYRESTRLLRRILRLDPATSHWGEDLRAFEDRRLKELEPLFAEAAGADDIARLLELQAELEEAWLDDRSRVLLEKISAALLRAREREATERGHEVVALISKAYGAFDFDALEQTLPSYRELLAKGFFRPSADVARQFEEAHEWFVREADEHEKEREFKGNLGALRAALDGGEAPGKEIESLWHILVNTGRPLPPDLERRVAVALENEQIVESRRKTRTVALGSLGAALALLLVLGTVTYVQYRRLLAYYVPQLEQARARNDLQQLAELRSSLEKHLFLSRFLRMDPDIQQQLGQERDVATRVDAKKRELKELLARMNRIAKGKFGEDADFLTSHTNATDILKEVAALREDPASYQNELDALAAQRIQFWEDALLQKEKEIGDFVAVVTSNLPPFETVGARALPDLQEIARRLEASVQAGEKAVAEYQALQKTAQLPGLSQAGVQSFEMAVREVRAFRDAIAERQTLGRKIDEAPTLAAYYEALRGYAQHFAGQPRATNTEAVLAGRKHGELLVAPPVGMAEAVGTPRLEAVADGVPADNYFWDALLQGVVDADKRAAQAWPEIQRAVGEWRADRQMVALDEFDYASDSGVYRILAYREFGSSLTGTPTMRFLNGGRVYPPKRTDERCEFLETPPNVYRDVNIRNRRPMAHCVFLNRFTASVAAAPPADAPALLLQAVLDLRGSKDMLNALLRLRLARLLTKHLDGLLGPGTVPEVDAALKEMEAADDGSLDPLCFQNPIVQEASAKAEAVLQKQFKDRAFLDRFRLQQALAREAIRRSVRWVGHADLDDPRKAAINAGRHPQELWALRAGAGAEMQLVVAAELQGVDYQVGETLQPGEPLFAPLKDDAPKTRDALKRLLADQNADLRALETLAWPPVWPVNRRR